MLLNEILDKDNIFKDYFLFPEPDNINDNIINSRIYIYPNVQKIKN